MLPNFKAVGQPQAELHSHKVEKLDACIDLFSQIQSHIITATAAGGITQCTSTELTERGRD